MFVVICWYVCLYGCLSVEAFILICFGGNVNTTIYFMHIF